MHQKNLQLERMVFFCDAVVAIAITLLALNIKIPATSNGHLSFRDLLKEWPTFSAFLLSFINIANFWKTHHTFFAHISKIDERVLWYNIWWLFFIVLLPFSTSLVSAYFNDSPAIFVYSANLLLIAFFQNLMWDYASSGSKFLKEESRDEPAILQLKVFCNLEMINALVGMAIAFINAGLAFLLLFTKLPMILIAMLLFRKVFPRPRKEGKA